MIQIRLLTTHSISTTILFIVCSFQQRRCNRIRLLVCYFFQRIGGREAYTCCRHHGKNFRCCCKKWRIDLYIALPWTVFKCNKKLLINRNGIFNYKSYRSIYHLIFAYYYFILNKYIEYEMNVDDIGKLLNAYDASHRSTKPEKQLWHNFFKFQTLKKRNINLQIYLFLCNFSYSMRRKGKCANSESYKIFFFKNIYHNMNDTLPLKLMHTTIDSCIQTHRYILPKMEAHPHWYFNFKI